MVKRRKLLTIIDAKTGENLFKTKSIKDASNFLKGYRRNGLSAHIK